MGVRVQQGHCPWSPRGVHNLSDDTRNAVFYVAAHTGVIYDYATRTQRLLQGTRSASWPQDALRALFEPLHFATRLGDLGTQACGQRRVFEFVFKPARLPSQSQNPQSCAGQRPPAQVVASPQVPRHPLCVAEEGSVSRW